MKLIILGENGSVHVQKWIKAISNVSEIELYVISFNRGLQLSNVKYLYLKQITGTKLDYFLNVFVVKKYIKQVKPDLIHAHYATSHGFLAAFSNFKPLIITGWGADIFDSPKNLFMKLLLQFSFRSANAITVLSQITLSEMIKLTNKKVELIPFGVDISIFKPLPISTISPLIKIGTIRTLTEKYGVEYLIRAFAIVEKKYPNIQLEIVGDGPLLGFLQNLTIELGVQQKVNFHGYVNQNSDFEHYITLLQSMDIFAILSILDSETFGVACVEASACAIPVIATSVGGLPEVINNEVTGIIVPPKNALATANALERLITNETLRKKLGANGRHKVEQYYNWEHNTQQMVQLYQQVITNNSTKR